MLLVINTWQRRELFARTLGRILSVKDPSTTITSVEDDITPSRAHEDVRWVCTLQRLGVGEAKKYAIRLAQTVGAEEVMFLDNDMLVEPGFDTVGLTPWREHRGEFQRCVGSSYRSFLSGHLMREWPQQGYVLGTSFPGACITMTREMVDYVVGLPLQRWNELWDWLLIGFICYCLRPEKSYMEHIGYDEYSLHHRSGDLVHP